MLIVAVIAGLMITIVVLAYFAYLIVLALAARNMFSTTIVEQSGKAIMVNGKFRQFIMASKVYIFRGEIDPDSGEIERWETVRRPAGFPPSRARERFFGGLHFIGIWPIVTVYIYRFTWTSLEQRKNEKSGDVELTLVTSEKDIDYILLQREDQYTIIVREIETAELLPVDVIAVFPVRVTNPYKALFIAERWLENTENRVGDALRDFLGGRTFEEIVKLSTVKGITAGPEGHRITNNDLNGVLRSIGEEYGVEIRYVLIRKVDPGSSEARKFVEASGAVYIADRKAKANAREGEGLGQRAANYYGMVAGIRNGPYMFGMEAVRDSKLRAITHPGGIMPTVAVDDVTDRSSDKQTSEGGSADSASPESKES